MVCLPSSLALCLTWELVSAQSDYNIPMPLVCVHAKSWRVNHSDSIHRNRKQNHCVGSISSSSWYSTSLAQDQRIHRSCYNRLTRKSDYSSFFLACVGRTNEIWTTACMRMDWLSTWIKITDSSVLYETWFSQIRSQQGRKKNVVIRTKKRSNKYQRAKAEQLSDERTVVDALCIHHVFTSAMT